MHAWGANIHVDQALVGTLLAEQFPELDATSARLLGEGWDNSVWAVEERLAFRFPRREVAVPLVARELEVLPKLAPLVPVPVPEPVHVGRSSDRYPCPFFGCPLLPGSEPADAGLAEADRVELGAQLGRFLRALHDPATRVVVDPEGTLPVDPNRRADMSLRAPRAREQLATISDAGLWQAPELVEAVLTAGEALAAPTAERMLAHGDLHFRHVLVADGAISAVIDWGDVCLADPCIDLVLVWLLLPPAGRDRFLAEYGPVDEERRLRSRVLAIGLGSMLALYARDVDHASLEREAVAELERTLVDWI